MNISEEILKELFQLENLDPTIQDRLRGSVLGDLLEKYKIFGVFREIEKDGLHIRFDDEQVTIGHYQNNELYPKTIKYGYNKDGYIYNIFDLIKEEIIKIFDVDIHQLSIDEALRQGHEPITCEQSIKHHSLCIKFLENDVKVKGTPYILLEEHPDYCKYRDYFYMLVLHSKKFKELIKIPVYTNLEDDEPINAVKKWCRWANFNNYKQHKKDSRMNIYDCKCFTCNQKSC